MLMTMKMVSRELLITTRVRDAGRTGNEIKRLLSVLRVRAIGKASCLVFASIRA